MKSLVVAIETSCDETAVAVVDGDRNILANCIYSQITEHAPFGGIVPEIASREHLARLPELFDRAIAEAGVDTSELTHVAVTAGPGLIGALLVGVQFAKGLAQSLCIPFIGVHHLEGHLLAGSLEDEHFLAPPFIGLIASGGHSALFRVDESLGATLLGETRDDAAGEAFDKSAKLLGLPYPGGAEIDKLAEAGDEKRFVFPKSLRDRATYDYSFSGVKTSVRNTIIKLHQNTETLPERDIRDVCAGLRRAIVDALLDKAILACRRTQVYRLVLGGGVVANSLLRSEALRRGAENELAVYVPPRRLCTDNAAMIAAAALCRIEQGHVSPLSIRPRANLPLIGAYEAGHPLVEESPSQNI